MDIFLSDIIEYAKLIEENIDEINKEQFIKDRNLIDATVRRLEVIGEAVKNIPDEFRKKHSDIPWSKIAGFRDIIIHAYFKIDLDLTWKIIKTDLPKLKKDIEKIVNFMQEEE